MTGFFGIVALITFGSIIYTFQTAFKYLINKDKSFKILNWISGNWKTWFYSFLGSLLISIVCIHIPKFNQIIGSVTGLKFDGSLPSYLLLGIIMGSIIKTQIDLPGKEEKMIDEIHKLELTYKLTLTDRQRTLIEKLRRLDMMTRFGEYEGSIPEDLSGSKDLVDELRSSLTGKQLGVDLSLGIILNPNNVTMWGDSLLSEGVGRNIGFVLGYVCTKN